MGTSNVDGYGDVDADNLDEEEQASVANDGSTQTVEY
jgi:hypothetical protein